MEKVKKILGIIKSIVCTLRNRAVIIVWYNFPSCKATKSCCWLQDTLHAEMAHPRRVRRKT